MSTRKATLVFFDNSMLGILVGHAEYNELGGKHLATAFSDHHVQLARQPDGQYSIIDDMGSDAYHFVENALVDEMPTMRNRVGASWELGANQPETVREELADLVVDA